jgi:hypothetical protein
MLEEENPYRRPESPASPVETGAVRLSAAMIANLMGASPWIRFMGVLGFIGAGFMALLGLTVLLGGGAIAAATQAEIFVAFSALGGFIYIGLGALYFFPSLFAYRFGRKLKNYCLTFDDNELDGAFKNNYSFWKFLGILTIVCLALVVSIIPIAVIVSVARRLAL